MSGGHNGCSKSYLPEMKELSVDLAFGLDLSPGI
jgi:hypothetical protein